MNNAIVITQTTRQPWSSSRHVLFTFLGNDVLSVQIIQIDTHIQCNVI